MHTLTEQIKTKPLAVFLSPKTQPSALVFLLCGRDCQLAVTVNRGRVKQFWIHLLVSNATTARTGLACVGLRVLSPVLTKPSVYTWG